jgi:hypothetical protein
MSLEQEFQGLVRSYVLGQVGLEGVRAWLADHVQAVADTRDAALDELTGEAWALLSEYDLGDRDEDSVRAELSVTLAVLKTVTRSRRRTRLGVPSGS